MKLEKLPLEFVSFFMPQRSSLTALHIYLFLHYIQNFGLLGEANTQVTNFKKKNSGHTGYSWAGIRFSQPVVSSAFRVRPHRHFSVNEDMLL
jgi:hypothetical protein